MRRYTLGLMLLAFMVISSSARSVAAAEDGDPRDPWSQVHYDADGLLVSAIGSERPGVPIVLSTERGTLGGRPLIKIRYTRGFDTLQIEKIYEVDYGLDLIYTAGEERLVVSITIDDLTGEALAVYRLPDGEVFSLWFSRDGALLSGDVDGLRRALKHPMEITRLMRSYLGQRKPFEDHLPSAAESLIAPVMYVSCTDACSAGCAAQCAFECSLLGYPGCQTCHTACAIGCWIGCGGS